MTTNTQNVNLNANTTTDQQVKKVKLVKGTKKQQAPAPCRPFFGG